MIDRATASLVLITERPEECNEDAPKWEDNWYRCGLTGDWVYKWADERVIASRWKPGDEHGD